MTTIDLNGTSITLKIAEQTKLENVKALQTLSNIPIYVSFHELSDTNKGILLNKNDVILIDGDCYVNSYIDNTMALLQGEGK